MFFWGGWGAFALVIFGFPEQTKQVNSLVEKPRRAYIQGRSMIQATPNFPHVPHVAKTNT